MCGLTGFIDTSLQNDAEALKRTVQCMADRLAHRGPDDEGVWVDAAAGVALGHRRLSIIDLSPLGHQPMASHDGRYVIVYNGEVYNFPDLRRELEAEGVKFRGGSDTEVIVEACAHWGHEAAIKRLNGMFAFALWDCRERQLVLARDHIGIKPLFWGQFGGLLLFGSELKALRAHKGWPARLNRQALASYLRHFYVPAPLSIFEGVSKLRPGHFLVWRPGETARITCYWDIREVAMSGQRAPYSGGREAALEELSELLMDSVERQMIADVPLGAFLSGGIDSSIVVAMMQAKSNRPVKTFTIGFEEHGFDEAPYAKAVAAHLGTEHTELYVKSSDALALIPNLHRTFDEPFADSSQLPTSLVSQLARQHVTVALSGDGGDELFAGYHHYRICEAAWRKMSKVPAPLRRWGAGLLGHLPTGLTRALGGLVPGALGRQLRLGRLQRIGGVLAVDGPDDLYRRIISQWQDPQQLMPGTTEPKGGIWDPEIVTSIPDFIPRMQYYDALQYMPDDVLTKVDRASMAVSLETRVPLLDHRVLEFAWRLPMSMKMGQGGGKWILRKLLGRHLPTAMIERPKMGFGVPIGTWLRGDLRDWAEDLLTESSLRADGFFDPAPIRATWKIHLSGEADTSYMIWTILMFQQWLHETKA